MAESGPNDASGVVWAIGVSFLIFVHFLYTNDNFKSYITNKCMRSPAIIQTGPNNARRVVWAIGMSFLNSDRVFYILIIISVIFRLYSSNKCTRSSNDDTNRPK